MNAPNEEGLTLATNTNSISPTLAFAGTAIATGLWLAALLATPQLQSSGVSVIVARITVSPALLATPTQSSCSIPRVSASCG